MNKVRDVEDVVCDGHCCDIPCVVLKLGPNDDGDHRDDSCRAGICCESCCVSRSWLGCQHCSGLSLDQVAR